MLAPYYAQTRAGGNRVGLHYSRFGAFSGKAWSAHQELAPEKLFAPGSNPPSRASDGQSFSPNLVDVTTAAPAFAGLGLAAGAGDTFWASTSGTGPVPIVKVFYDLANGTNEVQLSLSSPTNYNIGVD